MKLTEIQLFSLSNFYSCSGSWRPLEPIPAGTLDRWLVNHRHTHSSFTCRGILKFLHILHVLGLWEVTRVPPENPIRHREQSNSTQEGLKLGFTPQTSLMRDARPHETPEGLVRHCITAIFLHLIRCLCESAVAKLLHIQSIPKDVRDCTVYVPTFPFLAYTAFMCQYISPSAFVNKRD